MFKAPVEAKMILTDKLLAQAHPEDMKNAGSAFAFLPNALAS
jgi:hypothetical protein